ncbi:MAG: YhcH/YjgK/YiaL family protein [Planctomycetia bacterium]|nr:YhcH/YjgK/YiaL family protein [Planctomycetia bacterium]
MVFDRLENASLYAALHPRLARALAFLRGPDLAQLDCGRHTVEGDDVFALVQEYRTKPRAEGVWEAHRRYIDVQYVARGEECMGYASLTSLVVRQPYDGEKDVVLLDGRGDFVTVSAGMFTIFWPHDAHMPCLTAGVPESVRKIVVKVSV